ncbi:hypothetical protein AVU99_gp079 [Mycobacterium phage Lolly9]|uniref:Uncharacterized protein n=1 Tax=Mycobacterium phage Lolly9 TaxID=1698711 RepID=A0A0K2FP00_9CAUD|nr:hypothetical protein AVU99_gp079 [Mycobacterium phage Lolly9]ALA48518.1 hypothetical protein LOLLY9_101 [Mycobacterium phage Lolly9]
MVGSAIEYARKHHPDMVEQLEATRLIHAKRLVELTPP